MRGKDETAGYTILGPGFLATSVVAAAWLHSEPAQTSDFENRDAAYHATVVSWAAFALGRTWSWATLTEEMDGKVASASSRQTGS